MAAQSLGLRALKEQRVKRRIPKSQGELREESGLVQENRKSFSSRTAGTRSRTCPVPYTLVLPLRGADSEDFVRLDAPHSFGGNISRVSLKLHCSKRNSTLTCCGMESSLEDQQ